MSYVVDISWFDEGGYCQFYPLVGENTKGFKEFKNYEDAEQAFINQQLLNKYKLAPKIYSDIIRVPVKDSPYITSYGFVSQMANYLTRKPILRWKNKYLNCLEKIQNLVESIKYHTGLDFWDCHQYNVGLINKRIVCIDTGNESFDPSSDAWGLGKPGPKCYYCHKYICKCSTP
jgi:hypothetical protein